MDLRAYEREMHIDGQCAQCFIEIYDGSLAYRIGRALFCRDCARDIIECMEAEALARVDRLAGEVLGEAEGR